MKILLVDDDQINNKMLAKKLEKKGYEVIQAFNGNECLRIIENGEEVSLVLLDIMMPDLPGTEVLKNLREKFTAFELPIIMVTGKSETTDIVENLRTGANDYIVKPINIDVAEARIKTQLQLKSLMRENLKKKELETAHAMIVTYNHEINNPLTIALGLMRKIEKLPGDLEVATTNIPKIKNALNRVVEIVRKIDDLTETTKLEQDNYAEKDSMIKLK